MPGEINRPSARGGSGTRRRSVPRPWCIPPVMMRDAGEGLERVAVLEESEGELGVLLWRTVRDVELWAATPPARRAALFHPDSAERRRVRLAETEVPPELAAPLDTLSALLSLPDADEHTVAQCCAQIAGWAGGTRARETALAYAQAAALALPEDADAALQTGTRALHAGQRARAEVWLRRAVGLGRRGRQWDAYSRAVFALARLHERAANPVRAVRDYRLAHRAALRHGGEEVRLGAARALLRLARTAGDAERARNWAVAAQRAYRPGAPEATALLLELARFWLDAGRPGDALPALRRLAKREQSLDAGDRLSSAAMRVRALAAAGHAPGGQAAADVFTLLRDPTIPAPVQLAAAMDLAHAAAAQADAGAFLHAVHAALRVVADAEYAPVRDQLTTLARTQRFTVPLLQDAA
jgi:hypothetical protein